MISNSDFSIVMTAVNISNKHTLLQSILYSQFNKNSDMKIISISYNGFVLKSWDEFKLIYENVILAVTTIMWLENYLNSIE